MTSSPVFSETLPGAAQGRVTRVAVGLAALLIIAACLVGAGQWPLLLMVPVVLAPAVVVMALIAARPNLCILTCLFLLYSNAAVVAVRSHGAPFFLVSAIPLLLAIPVAQHVLFGRERLTVNSILELFLVFLGSQLLASTWSSDPRRSLTVLRGNFVEGFLLMFLLTNALRTPESLRSAIRGIVAAGAFMGGLSFLQQITGTWDFDYGGFAQVSFRKSMGPIGEQNYYAQMLLMTVPPGLFLFRRERSRVGRILAGLATAAAVLGCTATFSRGGAVGFLVIVLALTGMGYLRIRHTAALALGLSLLLILHPEYRARIASLQTVTGTIIPEQRNGQEPDTALKGRATEMLAAVRVFADYPLTGVGPGMFESYSREYAREGGLIALKEERMAHCLYLGVAAESGLPGLVCLLVVFAAVIRRLETVRRTWRSSCPELSDMAASLLLVVLSYLTTATFLSLAYERFIWIMVGVSCAIGSVRATEPSVPGLAAGSQP